MRKLNYNASRTVKKSTVKQRGNYDSQIIRLFQNSEQMKLLFHSIHSQIMDINNTVPKLI